MKKTQTFQKEDTEFLMGLAVISLDGLHSSNTAIATSCDNIFSLDRAV